MSLKSLEYYNPMWGKCCQHVICTVRINLSSREEEGILQKEVWTNHESFVRNGVVLALNKVHQEKQHAKDTIEMDDMMLWNSLILDFW